MSKDLVADLLKMMYLHNLKISAGMYTPIGDTGAPVCLRQLHTETEERSWIYNVSGYTSVSVTIWFEDGSWAKWDADELGWIRHVCPTLPAGCRPDVLIRDGGL